MAFFEYRPHFVINNHSITGYSTNSKPSKWAYTEQSPYPKASNPLASQNIVRIL